MEHVSHVESVSTTIARELGLNTELTRAIAMGHDLGHAPFGHQGEKVLKALCEKYLGSAFWHEANGLHFVDNIDLLEDPQTISHNLMLTYAVRDGILSHCGEVDENGLFPRDIGIDISRFTEPGKYQSVTWEGCLVKLADKIAYVGRDIEDANNLGFLDQTALSELHKMSMKSVNGALNTTAIMHNLIVDICENSSPDKGICLSDEKNRQLSEIKAFNYDKIYNHHRLEPFKNYAKLVLTQIFDELNGFYDGQHTWEKLRANWRYLPLLVDSFESWLCRYCDISIVPDGELKEKALACENKKIYGKLEDQRIYAKAIIDFLSGMTDRFAITVYNELLEY